MDSFYLLASAILFGLSIYTLARADGWGRVAAVSLAAGIFALPAVLFVVAIRIGVPGYALQTLIGLTCIAAMIVLFALVKSVARALRSQDDGAAPRR